MLVLAHEVRGRLRFASIHLKSDRRMAARLRSRLRAVDGVTSTSVNGLTGSLTVHYDGRAETRSAILGCLPVTHAGLGAPAERPLLPLAPRAPAPQGRTIADLVLGMVAERLVERAVRVAVGALI
jgi:hypothetical protein